VVNTMSGKEDKKIDKGQSGYKLMATGY